ncbi:Integrase core domain containing protein [Dirofilaria immitis]|nr:Integrase core domain containing protein [Dirofilaria immitis]
MVIKNIRAGQFISNWLKIYPLKISPTSREDSLRHKEHQKYDLEKHNSTTPWGDGIYERLIGLTKEALRKAIRRFLTEREMTTPNLKIEGILNTRPSTYVGFDNYRIIRLIDFISPTAIIRYTNQKTIQKERELAELKAPKELRHMKNSRSKFTLIECKCQLLNGKTTPTF